MLDQLSNVLIVEQRVNTVHQLRRILKSAGFQVFQAASEKQALNRAIQESVNVIFVNMSSHELDSERLLRDLRQKRPHPLIIGLVSGEEQKKALDAIREGMFDYMTTPLRQPRARLVLEDAFDRVEKLTTHLTERFKSFEVILDRMLRSNTKHYKSHLIQLAKESERHQAWAGERLDQIYRLELDPVFKNIRRGILPDRKQMNLVSRVRSEIQGIDPRYVPETVKYVSRIKEGYSILEEDEYLQDLENKHREITKKLLNPEGLPGRKIKSLKKKMREISEKILYYGH